MSSNIEQHDTNSILNIEELTIKNIPNNTVCESCFYFEECVSCPLQVRKNSTLFCEYALYKIKNILYKMSGRNYALNKNSKIIQYMNEYYIVNFVGNNAIKLLDGVIIDNQNLIISPTFDSSIKYIKNICEILSGDFLCGDYITDIT